MVVEKLHFVPWVVLWATWYLTILIQRNSACIVDG